MFPFQGLLEETNAWQTFQSLSFKQFRLPSFFPSMRRPLRCLPEDINQKISINAEMFLQIIDIFALQKILGRKP